MRGLFASRRFWSALVAVGAVVAVQCFGVSEAAASKLTEAITQIVSVLIGAYGVESAARVIKGGLDE